MDGNITLRSSERKALMEHYRRNPNPAVRLRAHIVLLLAAGYPWQTIAAMLFCSTRIIGRWKRRFERGRLAALREERRGRCAFQ
jgi:transposase